MLYQRKQSRNAAKAYMTAKRQELETIAENVYKWRKKSGQSVPGSFSKAFVRDADYSHLIPHFQRSPEGLRDRTRNIADGNQNIFG